MELISQVGTPPLNIVMGAVGACKKQNLELHRTHNHLHICMYAFRTCEMYSVNCLMNAFSSAILA